MDGKRTLILYTYEILRKFSSSRNPLTRQKIASYLDRLYNVEKVGLRTLTRCFQDFEISGYPLKYTQHGIYLQECFSDIETEVFNAPLIAARFLTEEAAKKIVKKIGSQLPESQEKTAVDRCNRFITAYTHSQCQNFYTNMLAIDEAIRTKQQIRFFYVDKRPDGTLRRRIHHNNSEPVQISCYAIIFSDNYFYVVGKSNSHPNISHYRIDKMDNIIITYDTAEPVSTCQGYETRQFKPQEYILENYKMFHDEIISVKIKVTGKTENKFYYNTHTVWMELGNRITDFRETGHLEAVATVRICPASAILFAKQFGDFVELLNPELREEMRRYHEGEAKKYKIF